MADISTWQQDGFAELCLRANARRYWPELGFRDPAAQLMLERLGFGSGKGGKHGQHERQALKRSRWFDRRCEQFFARYPQALCIELGAGFSTRFHRLSSQSDWPQFHWLEVDTVDIIQQKSHLLPRIDNYRLMASELASPDWLMAWKREPLIVLAEHQLMYQSPHEVNALFKRIAQRAKQFSFEIGEPLSVEIVFDYVSPVSVYWQQCLSRLGLSVGKRFLWGLGEARSVVDIDPAYSVLADESLRDLVNRRQRWLDNGHRWISGSKYLEACAAVAWNYLDDDSMQQC
jgi:hypothetical protein